jgi:hypothetical protein
MIFGHNTNVTVGNVSYHVQTEDRGASHAAIETTVYEQGRLVHKRTYEYKSLLPLNSKKEATLKQRLDEQHRAVTEEIRSGTLKLDGPAEKPAVEQTPVPAAQAQTGPRLKLRIQNAADWLKGRRASLKIRVTDELGNGVGKARVVARMEGTVQHVEVSAQTDADGSALLEFEMPKFAVADPFLIVHANWGPVDGRLRLQLKARPKVPAV